MNRTTLSKYRPYLPIQLKDRTWPDRKQEHAPRWCSVDLRDGNQALVTPMGVDEKTKFFKLLLEIGFKEIEVGFPAASDTEFQFLRMLIDNKMIPDDVTIQVLTQAREHLIERTFESLKGVKRAIVHLYNSTSALQRDVVFRMDRKEIRDIAIAGTKLVKKLKDQWNGNTEIIFQYSPESFSGTESDYAVEVCDAVMDAWNPNPNEKIIFNLPATVELTSPHIYADQIEYVCRNLNNRKQSIISIHTHNDRGCAVAATELALLAGGERVEGTLFGNGERTGNVDIVTLALNLYAHGIQPELDFTRINYIMNMSERLTNIPVHARHPYAGELVYTAFSGSHQDAINKGMAYYQREGGVWSVPYLPIDPQDLGRTYESIIRINSQSGKGGVAYILENEFGYQLPKSMQPEFSLVIQKITDATGKEIKSGEILEQFQKEYLDRKLPVNFMSYQSETGKSGEVSSILEFYYNGQDMVVQGKGNGPIDATKNTLTRATNHQFKVVNYSEHALSEGSEARAIAYIQIKTENENLFYGAGIDESIELASVKALFSAFNRAYKS